jgi:two-component system sensor kinase FixL
MTSNGGPERRLTVRTARDPDNLVQVSVSDSGPGFTEEQLARVFEPFYTTKPKGMGMGLAISASIVEEHRGKLRAVNNPEGGATFLLTLPPYEKEVT